jgi:sigma-B regulation protein RsbQ
LNPILKRNNVSVIGNGTQVMLFAHGFGCDQNAWKFITEAFTDEYKVVLFDYTGSGRSDIKQYNSQKYSTLDGYAQDVLDICEALNIKDAIFVGMPKTTLVGLNKMTWKRCLSLWRTIIWAGRARWLRPLWVMPNARN